jgi:hypothetical protein
VTALVPLVLGVALLLVVYLVARTLDLVRQVSTQLAVLTLRVTDLIEIVDALDTKVRMAADARRGGS